MTPTDKPILGLWDGHDAGAAVVRGHRILFAVNEERLTRRKLEVGFPSRSIRECAKFLGCQPGDLGDVAITTWDPAKTLTRCVPRLAEEYYLLRRRKKPLTANNRFRKLMKYWITELPPLSITKQISGSVVARRLRDLGCASPRVHWYDHHYGHATAAAFCSGFDSALVVTIDGIGDGLSGSISTFDGERLNRISAISGRSSLGIFFEHVTNLLNMRELEDEGKVMALANFAQAPPDAENPLLEFLAVDGLQVRAQCSSVRLYGALQRILWRWPSEQFAAMAQRVLEVKVVELIRNAIRETGLRRIACSGGVASNVKVNMLVHEMPEVERLFVFPHMGDGGLALGAAMALNHDRHGVSRYELRDLQLGPSFADDEILAAIKAGALAYEKPADVEAEAARLLFEGRVLFWFEGRMEIGPRALGGRSILARADAEHLKDELNLKLKKRVWYQPFCPTMLHEDAVEVLDNYKGVPDPFMTMAFRVKTEHRGALRAVTNIDGSCRPQILRHETTRYARLLREYKKLSGRGVLLDTSFNTHGEPIVCSPHDAVRTFLATDVSHMVMEDYLVTKRTRR